MFNKFSSGHFYFALVSLDFEHSGASHALFLFLNDHRTSQTMSVKSRKAIECLTVEGVSTVLWFWLCCIFLLFFPFHRSPSPEPIYNSEGKRLNTREYRTRKKLEEERHSLITEMVGLNPEFKPPADYKYGLYKLFSFLSGSFLSGSTVSDIDLFFFLLRPPATRVSDKVMIPQDEYPEINFVGLLIGPR